jgi:hypothetical protein
MRLTISLMRRAHRAFDAAEEQGTPLADEYLSSARSQNEMPLDQMIHRVRALSAPYAE